MSEVEAAARLQQHHEELCIAAIRALARERDLHFRARRLHRGRQRLPAWAPHLHPDLDRDDFGSSRGAADGLALRLRLSDDALHRRLAPASPLQRMLFDMLEQFRVESLAGDDWPGVQHNLQHRFEAWTRGFHDSGLAETDRGLLLFTVAQITRARVTAQPPLEEVEDPMEATRAGIAPLLGHALASLRRTRHDQAAYAEHALALAAQVDTLMDEAGAAVDDDGRASEREADERLVFGIVMDREERDDADAIASVAPGTSRLLQGDGSRYRVYTTVYDREARAATLLRREQLDEFRHDLDARVLGQGLNIARLARELEAVLATDQRDDWASAQEEGLIDGRRLAQLVASPAERRLFKQERREREADCVVGFLIDCSGSMRQPAEKIAVVVDVLARALDLAGASSEVLGFSTGAWQGGRALKDWQRAGRPPHPGRMNETLHLVFKDGDTPWRRARRDIAALFKGDLFREGVDGEALAWAANRLRARPERRRILVAISDGCPMDRATELANDSQYLDHHLQQVAGEIEAAGDVELRAIGVGLDLSPYYGQCHALDLDRGLGMRVFQEIVALLGHHRRR